MSPEFPLASDIHYYVRCSQTSHVCQIVKVTLTHGPSGHLSLIGNGKKKDLTSCIPWRASDSKHKSALYFHLIYHVSHHVTHHIYVTLRQRDTQKFLISGVGIAPKGRHTEIRLVCNNV